MTNNRSTFHRDRDISPQCVVYIYVTGNVKRFGIDGARKNEIRANLFYENSSDTARYPTFRIYTFYDCWFANLLWQIAYV